MRRGGGNRLVIAAESSFARCLAQALSVFVLRFGCFCRWPGAGARSERVTHGRLALAKAVFSTSVVQAR